MKGHICLNIDVDVWEAVKNRYPRKISPMINDFLRGIINAPEIDMEDLDEKDIQDAIKSKSETLTELKSELAALHAQHSEWEKKQEELNKYAGLSKREWERRINKLKEFRAMPERPWTQP